MPPDDQPGLPLAPSPAPIATSVAATPATVVASEPAAAPASSPAPETAPAASPAPASPAVEPAPVPPGGAEAASVVPAADVPRETPATESAKPAEPPASVLSEAGVKPAEPAKPAEAPKVEAAALPKFEAYKIPDGVTLEPAKIEALNTVLGEFAVNAKADSAAVHALGQRLLDVYVADQRVSKAAQDKAGQDAWKAVRDGWTEKFKTDPEIGGNRQETTVRVCGDVLNAYARAVGDERANELRSAFRITGLGDHPEMIRFVHHMARYMTERTKPIAAIVPKAPQAAGSARRARYAASAQTNGAA